MYNEVLFALTVADLMVFAVLIAVTVLTIVLTGRKDK